MLTYTTVNPFICIVSFLNGIIFKQLRDVYIHWDILVTDFDFLSSKQYYCWGRNISLSSFTFIIIHVKFYSLYFFLYILLWCFNKIFSIKKIRSIEYNGTLYKLYIFCIYKTTRKLWFLQKKRKEFSEVRVSLVKKVSLWRSCTLTTGYK